MNYLLIILFLLVGRFQQDDIPFCSDTQGAYYQPDIFPRYEYHNNRFLLVNYQTGEEVQILSENLETDSFWIVSWSPGCRYITAAVNQQRDYYIWDTSNGQLIGSVERGRRLYWRTGLTHALIETPNGAILWDMNTNHQILLEAPYDEWDGRNFRTFTWDNENNWLITTHIDGVRYAYDISTGADVTQDYQLTIINTPQTSETTSLNCSYAYETYLNFYYEPASRRIVATNRQQRVLSVLEEDIDVDGDVDFLGWSSSCRYVVLSLGSRENSDTVAFDIINGGRVGEFPDAQGNYHQISFAPASDYAIIETRHGGYLWHIPTNTQILLTDAHNTHGRNFTGIQWEPERGTILTVPVGAANGVMVYDYNGQQVAFYPTSSPITPVSYVTIDDQNKIIVYTYNPSPRYDGRMTSLVIYDRSTGEGTEIFTGRRATHPTLSPDGRYLAMAEDRYFTGENPGWGAYLRIWDLSNLPEDITQRTETSRYTVSSLAVSSNAHFYTNTIYTSDNLYWDILTGERIDPPVIQQTATSIESPYQSGLSPYHRSQSCPYIHATYYNDQIRYQHHHNYYERTYTVTIYDGDDIITTYESPTVSWSIDCRYINLNDTSYDLQTRTYTSLVPFNGSIFLLSPDRQFALIERRHIQPFTYYYEYEYVLYRFSDETELTTFCVPARRIDICSSINRNVYWDFNQNQIIMQATFSRPVEYRVYDLWTGEYRSSLFTADRSRYLHSYSAYLTDNLMLVISEDAITLWNFATLESHQVIADGVSYRDFALSPDNAYLVARSAFTIAIWNLNEYDRDIDTRTPIIIPLRGTFEFVNTHVIEINGEVFYSLCTGERITDPNSNCQ